MFFSKLKKNKRIPTLVTCKMDYKTKTLRKIITKLEALEQDLPDGCTAGPLDDDLFHWKATIIGPVCFSKQFLLFCNTLV